MEAHTQKYEAPLTFACRTRSACVSPTDRSGADNSFIQGLPVSSSHTMTRPPFKYPVTIKRCNKTCHRNTLSVNCSSAQTVWRREEMQRWHCQKNVSSPNYKHCHRARTPSKLISMHVTAPNFHFGRGLLSIGISLNRQCACISGIARTCRHVESNAIHD